MKIRAIIFDSSAVINLPIYKMRDEFRKIVSYYLPEDEAIKKYEKLFEKLQKGEITLNRFFDKLFEGLAPEIKNKLIEEHNKVRNNLVKLHENINSVLNNFSKKYKIGLLSNMPKELFMNDAKRLGLNLNSFSAMVFCSDLGILKPDKRVFEEICKELKEDPKRCVYITNHEEEKETASKIGMSVIGYGIEGDMKIRSLSELIDIFETEDETIKNIHEVDEP